MDDSPRGRVRALAAFFAAGGALCLVSVVLPTWPGVHAAGIATIGAIAVLGAALLLVRPAAVPSWLFHATIALGNSLIAGVVVLAGGGEASASWSVMYIWAPVHVAAFCRQREFVAHFASTIALHAGALVVLGDVAQAPTRVLLTAVSALVAASVVGILVTRIRALAGTDDLTGLPNRRAFEEALARAHAAALRTGEPLCVAVVDLDGFKVLNDAHGHAHGDDVLRHTAALWSARLRADDVLARLGGDEFGLVLPRCTPTDAETLGRALVASTPPGVGASVGVAALRPAMSASQLLAAADAALYMVKRDGGKAVGLALGTGSRSPDADRSLDAQLLQMRGDCARPARMSPDEAAGHRSS